MRPKMKKPKFPTSKLDYETQDRQKFPAAKNGAAYGLSVEIETAKTLLLNNLSALVKRLLDSKSLKGFSEEEVETLSNLSDDDFLSVSKAQNDLDELRHLRELAKQKVKISNILKECKTSTASISHESFKLLDEVRKGSDLTLLDIDSDEIDRVLDEYKFTQAISAYENAKKNFEELVRWEYLMKLLKIDLIKCLLLIMMFNLFLFLKDLTLIRVSLLEGILKMSTHLNLLVS